MPARRAIPTRADRRSVVILYDLPEVDVRSEGVVDGIDVEHQRVGGHLDRGDGLSLSRVRRGDGVLRVPRGALETDPHDERDRALTRGD